MLGSGPGFGNNGIVAQGATASAYPNNWYSDYGSKINRMNDRVFVGAATVNDGKFATTVRDWLDTLWIASSSGAPVSQAQFAATTTNGLIGGVFGSQGLNAPYAGTPIIGAAFYGVNNNATLSQSVWAMYGEARVYVNNATSQTLGFELDATNLSGTDAPGTGVSALLPVKGIAALWLASGGGVVSAKKSSLAIGIVNNGSNFITGIAFEANSIDGALGDGVGYGNAIQFAIGHTMIWKDTSGNPVASIACGNTATANRINMNFGPGAVTFSNPTNSLFQIGYNSSAVNGITINAGNTGVPPVIGAIGTDTNIDVVIQPKGTGRVVASGAVVPQSYTFATLPAAASNSGARAFITDGSLAAAGNYGAAAAGGGANKVPVFSNGTSWLIG